MLGFWLGGASAVPGLPPEATAGYRSICCFFLGGASAVPGIIPPEPPSGGGAYMRPSTRRLEDELARQIARDDEELAIIIPCIWITLWHDDV